MCPKFDRKLTRFSIDLIKTDPVSQTQTSVSTNVDPVNISAPTEVIGNPVNNS